MPKLKLLCLGAGAVGTYVGGSLALAGEQLVFLARAPAADELRARGLRLDLSLDRRQQSTGTTILEPGTFVATASIEEALRYGPFDAAVFALKSYDTAAALEAIRPFAERLPPVWCLSNGIDNEPAIARVLGPGNVIPGTLTTAIGRRGVGSIVLERLRGIGIALAPPLSRELLTAANAALLNPRPFANSTAMKWSKLLTNLVANATSAILDMAPAEIFAQPGLYALEIGMLREALAVMRAQRIPVINLPGTRVRALAFAARLPVWLSRPILAGAASAGRGGKMPSFHTDLHSGRGRSEVEYLHGAVVRVGREFGVPTPINQMLTETLMALTRNEIPLEAYAHQPEKLLAKLGS